MPDGYILNRYAGRGLGADDIAAFLAELVATDPRNALPEYDNPPIWDAPLVGIASAADPLFQTLKRPEVVGPMHVDADHWLEGAKSVIASSCRSRGPSRPATSARRGCRPWNGRRAARMARCSSMSCAGR